MDISPNEPFDGTVQRAFVPIWAFGHRSEALAIWRITQHPVTPLDSTLSVTTWCCFWLRFRSGWQAGSTQTNRTRARGSRCCRQVTHSHFHLHSFHDPVFSLECWCWHAARPTQCTFLHNSGLDPDPSFQGGLVYGLRAALLHTVQCQHLHPWTTNQFQRS